MVDTCIELFLFPDLSPFDICVNVEITPSGVKVLGQNYSLTCDATVTGADAEEPSVISYQWTKDNGSQVGTGRLLSFSPLRLSDAGRYACQATVTINPCNNTGMETQDVTLQSELGNTI